MDTKARRIESEESACKAVACHDCGVYQLCAPFGVDQDVDAVLDGIIKRRATFRRGEVIYAMGQPAESVYAIKSGSNASTGGNTIWFLNGLTVVGPRGLPKLPAGMSPVP